MIGLILVTHGRLATEFVAALEHVVGPQDNIEAICIGADDDMEQRRKEILASVERVDDGSGVVLLTDMFGGTPSNLAISVMENHKCRGYRQRKLANVDKTCKRPRDGRIVAGRG